MGGCSVGQLDLKSDRRDHGTVSREVPMLDNVNKVQFGIGLLVVFAAAGLLLADVLESGAAAGFGFIGIALIAASGWNRNRNCTVSEPEGKYTPPICAGMYGYCRTGMRRLAAISRHAD